MVESNPVRVSVVVPLYNKERTIRRALDSICHQTLTNFEVIVVDDGSTDGGGAKVEAYGDERVRLLRQPNGGPGAARNTGWRSGLAPLIAFLDGDDEWEPEFLAKSVSAIETQGSDLAMSVHAWHDEPGGIYPKWARAWQPGRWQAAEDTPVQELISRLAFCSPCTALVRRSVIENYGGFYERGGCRYAEDAHLFLKILLNQPVWMGHEALARFHREDSSLSGNYRKVRPIEPFLSDPDDIRNVCPATLRELAERFLAARSHKTALVLGYWGEWRKGRQLMQKFALGNASSLPYYWSSLLATHPLTGWTAGRMGWLHRAVKRWRAGA